MTASKPNPTIVFVGGAFHMPVHFQAAVEALAKLDYKAIAIVPPKIGRDVGALEPNSKIMAIRTKLEELIVEQGKEVMLVCHSSGGFSGCQSVKGLERSRRESKSEPGGVAHVVFLSAFTIPEGKTVVEVLGGSLPPWAEIQPDNMTLCPSAMCPSLFFSDLDEASQQKWGNLLEPQPLEGLAVKDSCWEIDIPKAYIFTTNDPVAPYDVFEPLLDEVKAGFEDQWTVLKIHSDHAPFLSRPDEFARLLIQLA